MAIDWTQAPEGTTHGMVNGGEMRWYRVGEHVECWNTTYREWIRSFFLSIEEVRDSGLYLYANGEQSELVMLREQVAELAELLRMATGEIPEVQSFPSRCHRALSALGMEGAK